MKARITTCVLLLSVVPGIALAASPPTKVSEVAGATGLTERQVKMVFGCHTAYAEYRTSYDRVEARFIKALGEERYRDLMAGREIVLDNGVRVAFNDR